MVQFAVSSMFFHEYPIDLIFDYVEEAGLSGIEFWIETPHFWLRELPAEEISDVVTDHPVLTPISIHAPVLDLNPCSINPGVAAVSIQYALKSIELAEGLGARVVTVHPGRRTAKRVPSDADYRRFEYYMSILRASAVGKGVCIAMENMEARVNSLLCTPGDVSELLLREPWLYFTLDIAHALATSRREVYAFIDCCLDRILNIHVSGRREGMIHLPVHGDKEIGTILRHLHDSGYDGYLTLELEDRNFNQDLNSEEKITLLERELTFLESYFG